MQLCVALSPHEMAKPATKTKWGGHSKTPLMERGKNLDDSIEIFCENVKQLLSEIREIRTDTGYSSDQVLLAMLVEAVRGVVIAPDDGENEW